MDTARAHNKLENIVENSAISILMAMNIKAMVSEEAAQGLSGSGGFIRDLREESASLLGLLAKIKV